MGCHGVTFRNRQDGLCPRCAWQAEHLIEQIELECLEADLALITAFEAYCTRRDRSRTRPAAAAPPRAPLFGQPLLEAHHRTPRPFSDFEAIAPVPVWSDCQPVQRSANPHHRRSA